MLHYIWLALLLSLPFIRNPNNMRYISSTSFVMITYYIKISWCCDRILIGEQRNELKRLVLLHTCKRLNWRRRGWSPYTDSFLSEGRYLKEILERNSAYYQEILTIEKYAFVDWCIYWKSKSSLQNSHYIHVKEKMAIFLMTFITLSHNTMNHVLRRRLKHSFQTLSLKDSVLKIQSSYF